MKHGSNPIVTGRLTRAREDFDMITGHTGDVLRLQQGEYEILKRMTGFKSMEEIAEESGIPESRVNAIFQRYYSEKRMVTTLAEWNRIGWCEKCGTYVAGDKCGICGSETEKIVFLPPCDPFICFDEERKFIVNKFKEKFGLEFPENALFVAANGCEDNVFYWEVAYKGEIILKINFRGLEEESWEFTLLKDKAEIHPDAGHVFDDAMLAKMIKANSLRQKYLVDTAQALILESNDFFYNKPLIYFSGGKESLVMLLLYSKLNVDANVLTVATGVDFPDDIAYTKDIRAKLDVNNNFKFYFYEGDEEEIISTLKEKKVLSAKEPWCRNNFKEKLKSLGTKDIYGGTDFAAAEGSRWYESDYRRRFPKIDYIKRYQYQAWIHPVAEWTSFDCWIFLFENKVPMNPVYKKGFQRTTCWLCPIVNPFHIQCSKKYYPDLWNKIPECRLDAFDNDTTKDLPF